MIADARATFNGLFGGYRLPKVLLDHGCESGGSGAGFGRSTKSTPPARVEKPILQDLLSCILLCEIGGTVCKTENGPPDRTCGSQDDMLAICRLKDAPQYNISQP
jgi:hypothetical protein